MAVFTFLDDSAWNSYTDLAGGTLLSHTTTKLVYRSDTGFRVILHGTGFTFNGKGLPTGGTITGLDVYHDTVHLAQYTGLATSLTTYVTLALGQTAGSTVLSKPDMTSAYETMRSGSDEIHGSNYGRNYDGFAGNDTFYGGSGDDWFFGGSGYDSYYGGEGRDGVSFWQENQTSGVSIHENIYGTGFWVVVNDGTGAKDYGFTSIKMFEGTDLADIFDFSHVWTNCANLEVWLLGGNDTFAAEAVGDTVYGGDGKDSISGAKLADGGAGVDTFHSMGGSTIAFWSADTGGHGASANLSLSTKQILDDGFGNVESTGGASSFYGTKFADRFIGNAFSNGFWGNDGNDTLDGGAGFDSLYGGKGSDRIYGGGGDDEIQGGRGKDVLAGGAGNDNLGFWDVDATGHGVIVNLGLSTGNVIDDGYGNTETATGFETLSGSDYADVLTGGASANLIWGNAGNDTLAGAGGNDTLIGGAGDDSLVGGDGNDAIWSFEGADTVVGGAGADVFYFGDDVPGTGGADLIADMVHGVDKLGLGTWWSSHLTGQTVLTSGEFLSMAGATVAIAPGQLVIYDPVSGKLFFDADATGSAYAPVLIGVVAGHPTLTYQDFVLTN